MIIEILEGKIIIKEYGVKNIIIEIVKIILMTMINFLINYLEKIILIMMTILLTNNLI